MPLAGAGIELVRSFTVQNLLLALLVLLLFFLTPTSITLELVFDTSTEAFRVIYFTLHLFNTFIKETFLGSFFTS